LTTNPIFQESFVVRSAQKVLDYIDEIKNTQIDDTDLHKLTTLFRILVEACNSKPLKTFPVKIIDKPIDEVDFEIRNTNSSKPNFSEVPAFVVDSIRQAEKLLDDGQCLDALRVLIDYCNVVVYSRFARGLELGPKKIDDWNSSNVISTHLAIGEDSCIT
jgi:hypothetical protein